MAVPVRLTSRGARSRERLLRAAAAELASASQLEVASVARRADVSAGLPYRYFGTRSGLLVAVVEDFYTRLGEAAVFRRYEAPTWRERERERIHAWVSFLYREPLAPIILGVPMGDGEVAAATAASLRLAIEIGGRNIAQGQRDSELPGDRDPELLAAAVLGGVHRAVVLALSRDSRPPLDGLVHELWAFVAGAVGLTNLDLGSSPKAQAMA
jgi:AcrR family transcriptional regulator